MRLTGPALVFLTASPLVHPDKLQQQNAEDSACQMSHGGGKVAIEAE